MGSKCKEGCISAEKCIGKHGQFYIEDCNDDACQAGKDQGCREEATTFQEVQNFYCREACVGNPDKEDGPCIFDKKFKNNMSVIKDACKYCSYIPKLHECRIMYCQRACKEDKGSKKCVPNPAKT